jgi:hypothetical protein
MMPTPSKVSFNLRPDATKICDFISENLKLGTFPVKKCKAEAAIDFSEYVAPPREQTNILARRSSAGNSLHEADLENLDIRRS